MGVVDDFIGGSLIKRAAQYYDIACIFEILRSITLDDYISPIYRVAKSESLDFLGVISFIKNQKVSYRCFQG